MVRFNIKYGVFIADEVVAVVAFSFVKLYVLTTKSYCCFSCCCSNWAILCSCRQWQTKILCANWKRYNVTKIAQNTHTEQWESERKSKKKSNNKTMTNRATDKIDQGDIKPLNKETTKNSIKQINWFRLIENVLIRCRSVVTFCACEPSSERMHAQPVTYLTISCKLCEFFCATQEV